MYAGPFNQPVGEQDQAVVSEEQSVLVEGAAGDTKWRARLDAHVSNVFSPDDQTERMTGGSEVHGTGPLIENPDQHRGDTSEFGGEHVTVQAAEGGTRGLLLYQEERQHMTETSHDLGRLHVVSLDVTHHQRNQPIPDGYHIEPVSPDLESLGRWHVTGAERPALNVGNRRRKQTLLEFL